MIAQVLDAYVPGAWLSWTAVGTGTRYALSRGFACKCDHCAGCLSRG